MRNCLGRLATCTVSWCRLGLIGVLVFVGFDYSLALEPMSPGPHKAPLKYAIQLPLYCWGQYFGRIEPQYQLPPRQLCGVITNHFCPGLIYLYQAREELNPSKKKHYMSRARSGFLYTKNGIKQFPRCPLHQQLAPVLAEVEWALKALP